MSLTHAAAGWYPDPWRLASIRYWDGTQWTAHVFTYPHAQVPETSTPSKGFRVLAWATVAALGLSAVVLAWGVWLDFQYRSLFVTDDLTIEMMEDAAALGLASNLQELGVTVVFGLAVVLFLSWLAVAFRQSGHDGSVVWALLCWWIPLINLMEGFSQVYDIQRLAAQRAERPERKVVLFGWWVATVVGSVTLWLGAREWAEVTETEDLKLADAITQAANLSIVGGLLLIAAAALASATVLFITNCQLAPLPSGESPGAIAASPGAIAVPATVAPPPDLSSATVSADGPPSYPSEPINPESDEPLTPPA